MKPSQGLLWKIYTGVLGAVTTIAAQKLVHASWKVATGEEPPEPNDPDTPLNQAVIWALASAIGVGVVQLMTNRFAARRWHQEIGTEHPQTKKINLKI